MFDKWFTRVIETLIVALLCWMASTTYSVDKKLAVIESKILILAVQQAKIDDHDGRITDIEYILGIKPTMKGETYEQNP